MSRSRGYRRPFLVYSKSEYTTRIGSVSGRPAVYTITLHNYIRLRWKLVDRIVSAISRSSSKMRMIRQELAELLKKLSLLTRSSLRRSTGIFFKKKFFSQNYLKHIWINSVFNADSDYDISFEPNCSFLTKSCLKMSQIHKNCIPRPMCLDMSQITSGFGIS
jgi:hypothetical protein